MPARSTTAIVLSVLASALSISAICLYAYKSIDNTALCSTILSVLTILVTVIIGWQIYVLLDLRKYQEDFKDLEKEFQRTKDHMMGFSALAYARTNLGWITSTPEEEWFKDYIYFSIDALTYLSQAGDFETCWAIASDLITAINGGNPKFYSTLKALKSDIIMSLMGIKEPHKIDNLKELIDFIKSV